MDYEPLDNDDHKDDDDNHHDITTIIWTFDTISQCYLAIKYGL